MKQKLDLAFFDNQYRWLVLFLVTYVLAYYWLPEQIPFFYSQVLPEEKLASKYYLLILPALVSSLFIVSQFLLQKLALNNRNMLALLAFFRVGMASACYFLFIRIILLVI